METGRTTPALRAFAIVEQLVGRTFEGMTAAELAERLGCPRTNINRDLGALVDAGWAEQLPSGRYSVTPRLVGLLKAYNINMSRAQDRIDQFQHRSEAMARQLLPSNPF